MISDGMVRGLKEYFKEYKGCRNCKHRPEPLQMCERGRWQTCIELICSRWERREEDAETLIRILQFAQQWIPCSERLPENDDEVLTTYIVNGNRNKRYVEIATYYADDSEWYWSSPRDEYRVIGTRVEVIAWMPLPKPARLEND